MAFARYSFTSKLLCAFESCLSCPSLSAVPTLMQYDCTHFVQYTTPLRLSRCMPYTIHNWYWQYHVKAKPQREATTGGEGPAGDPQRTPTDRMRGVTAEKVAVCSEHRTCGGLYSSKNNINPNYKKKQNIKLLLAIRSLCIASTEPAEDIKGVIVVIIIIRRNRILKYRSIAIASSSRTPERIGRTGSPLGRSLCIASTKPAGDVIIVIAVIMLIIRRRRILNYWSIAIASSVESTKGILEIWFREPFPRWGFLRFRVRVRCTYG